MKKIRYLLSLHLFLFASMIFYIIFIYNKNINFYYLFLIIIIILIIILCFIFKNYYFLICILLFLIIYAFFILRLNIININYQDFNKLLKGNTGLIAEIAGFPEIKNNDLEIIVSVIGIKYKENNDYLKTKKFKALLKIKKYSQDIIFNKGDILLIYDDLKLPRQKIFNFKYRDFLFNKNIFGYISVDVEKVKKVNNKINRFLINKILDKLWIFRINFFNKLKFLLNEVSYSFIISIFFGERSELDNEIYSWFTNTGMIHLIAISGLNIGFVSIIFYRIFKLFLSKSKSLILSLVIITLYVLLIKPSASCYRAYFMYLIIVIFFIISICSRNFTVLLISGIILLFINPFYIYDLGFQFSFFATAGIILLNNEIKEMININIHEKIKSLISVTLSAFLSVFILQWSIFKRVPFFSLISSIIVVPLFELMFGILFFLIIFIYLTNSILVARIIEIIISLFLKLIEFLDNIPSVDLPEIPQYTALIFFVILVIFFYIIKPLFKRSRLLNLIRNFKKLLLRA